MRYAIVLGGKVNGWKATLEPICMFQGTDRLQSGGGGLLVHSCALPPLRRRVSPATQRSYGVIGLCTYCEEMALTASYNHGPDVECARVAQGDITNSSPATGARVLTADVTLPKDRQRRTARTYR